MPGPGSRVEPGPASFREPATMPCVSSPARSRTRDEVSGAGDDAMRILAGEEPDPRRSLGSRRRCPAYPRRL